VGFEGRKIRARWPFSRGRGWACVNFCSVRSVLFWPGAKNSMKYAIFRNLESVSSFAFFDGVAGAFVMVSEYD
jgi:hypothetical protein